MKNENKRKEVEGILAERFRYDKIPIMKLNKLQLETKKIIEDKIINDSYQFRKYPCVVCGSKHFKKVGEKDRYGLYAPVVICKRCGLLQLNPRMRQKDYNNFYATLYRKLYVGKEKPNTKLWAIHKSRGKEIYDFIRKRSQFFLRNNFIVEIGAGMGTILYYFKKKGNKVLGLDLDPEGIKYGRRKKLNLKIGNIMSLSALKRKPDVVIYSHVLEHILNPVKELKILRKYMRPNSLLYIEVPGVRYLQKSNQRDFLTYVQNAHIYYFTLTSLINCTKKAGFKLEYGNEDIKALLSIGKIDNNYKNDYKPTILFLKKLENKIKKDSNCKIKVRNFFNFSLVRRIKKRFLYSFTS